MTATVRSTYRIGEVARQSGMTVEALRYYERKGLVPRPPRSAGGLRRYPADVLQRLRFIKQAQTLGLTLKEIQQWLGYAGRSRRGACVRVRDMLARQVADIDRRLAELRELRETLVRYHAACEDALMREKEPVCPTWDVLESSDA